jgi:hypothetical protein
VARRPPELFDELLLLEALEDEDDRVVEIFELLVQPELLFQFEDLVLAELRVTLRLVPLVASLSLLKSLMVLVSPTGINIL